MAIQINGIYSADRRTLHISTNYIEYENFNVSVELSKAQAKLVDKFKNIARGKSYIGAGSKAEAQILSDFFYKIKQIDRQGSLNKIEDAAFLSIIKRAKILTNGNARGKLLPKSLTSGTDFEKVLGSIITATMEYASGGTDLSYLNKKTQFGAQSFRAGILGNLENEIMQFGANIVQSKANVLKKSLQSQVQNKNNDYVNIQLSSENQSNAKIDVSGRIFANIEIIINPTSQIGVVANLLKRASFSAKNYDMSYYRNQIKQRVQFQSERNIQLLLGKTKLDTVFFSLFSEEYPAPVVLSFLFYSLNTRNEQIRMKLAQLRFIYELTGYGQHYINNEIEQLFKQEFDESPFRVNYFIWNNPSTDTITVKSTAELIEWSYNNYYENLTNAIKLPAKLLL